MKARIRLALNTMQLPISDINYQDKFTDSICEEIIRQGAEQNQEQQARKAEPKSYWFVGAMHKDKDGNKLDKTESFLKEGIWENGYDDKYLDKVKAARSGDRIAIKAAYTRKNGLPFDNRKNIVSVMSIKATGVVLSNPGNGQTLKVDWQKEYETPREWYFYTNRGTIWQVQKRRWQDEELIQFAFNEQAQDVDRFRNSPFWKERFGDKPKMEERFLWTKFYEELANKLLDYQHDRSELVAFTQFLAKEFQLSYMLGKNQTDTCPFTVMGMFNRGITVTNRRAIATKLAAFLNVEAEVPQAFDGVPILNNQKSWFFGFEDRRQEGDIDALWALFESALIYTDTDLPDARDVLCQSFDKTAEQYGTGWNLTMGLYWIRPWDFVPLDSQSREYIQKGLGETIGTNGHKGRCSASDYMALIDQLLTRFNEDAYSVHSFPELSLSAWQYDASDQTKAAENDPDDELISADAQSVTPAFEPYGLEDIVNDGCFLDKDRLQQLLNRLRTKKNLILQGPPGTGKTWLAKRLAYALMGQKNQNALRSVQFHPNLSYEDFVRGWRPSGDGKLELVDGPFLEAIKKARSDSDTLYVFVIEEINRGNPAQIFGEMLTLLEADKRTPAEALELCYRRTPDERVHIPDNLYVIGTMNVADRSLALVDLALRRRFAFVDLAPAFGEVWQNWVHDKAGIDKAVLQDIERRLLTLNEAIAADRNLGQQFRVGHSFVTPAFSHKIDNAYEWFRQVIHTEIGPLLDEYWFDDLGQSAKAQKTLLEGL
ncbi:McrB family protein [Endozoicomonas montiporae]|uniref:McrB family protein n=1 Tax=Endozoicomonas montiporae TaxID=1027273 RepID=UPI001FD61941|nr:AAA family ATPase [Endozoicomonas montiporae]